MNHNVYMVEFAGDVGGSERLGSGAVLVDDDDDVVSNVSLALYLLWIVRAEW